MAWVIYSLIYAIFNAIYLGYNSKYHYNAYFLGIIRGFGISLISLPFLFTTNLNIDVEQLILLIIQGILIGFYDSHIFFASSRYGVHSTSGFLATSVLVTLICWWIIEFNDLKQLLFEKVKFISICFILSGISISYWAMMNVHINSKAEKYLYPAVFALAFMSISTRYITLYTKNIHDGIIHYLVVSCFISGIYNFFCYIKYNKKTIKNKRKNIKIFSLIWLIIFSTILITAKSMALRLAFNPSYVVAMLLISPIFADLLNNKKFKINDNCIIFFTFILLLILFSLEQ